MMLGIPYETKILSPKYVGEVKEYDGKQTGREIKLLQIDNIGEYKDQFLRLARILVLL